MNHENQADQSALSAGGLHKKQMYRITGTGCGLPGSIAAGVGAAAAVLCGRKGLLL